MNSKELEEEFWTKVVPFFKTLNISCRCGEIPGSKSFFPEITLTSGGVLVDTQSLLRIRSSNDPQEVRRFFFLAVHEMCHYLFLAPELKELLSQHSERDVENLVILFFNTLPDPIRNWEFKMAMDGWLCSQLGACTYKKISPFLEEFTEYFPPETSFWELRHSIPNHTFSFQKKAPSLKQFIYKRFGENVWLKVFSYLLVLYGDNDECATQLTLQILEQVGVADTNVYFPDSIYGFESSGAVLLRYHKSEYNLARAFCFHLGIL